MSTDYSDTDDPLRIPSTELNGTNASKVMQIDSLLSQLSATRRQLMRDASVPVLDDSKLSEATARNWWLAGTVLVVLLAVMTFGAWVTGARGVRPALLAGPVVHENF